MKINLRAGKDLNIVQKRSDVTMLVDGVEKLLKTCIKWYTISHF